MKQVVSPMRMERFVATEEPLKYISRIPIFHLQTVKVDSIIFRSYFFTFIGSFQCEEYGKPIQAPLKDTISQGVSSIFK